MLNEEGNPHAVLILASIMFSLISFFSLKFSNQVIENPHLLAFSAIFSNQSPCSRTSFFLLEDVVCSAA